MSLGVVVIAILDGLWGLGEDVEPVPSGELGKFLGLVF